MKTSNKILFGSGLLIVTLIVLLLIVSLILLNKSLTRDDSYDSLEQRVVTQYDLRDFKEIEINDNWTVTIRQGEKYAVEVSAPQHVLDRTRVEVTGGRLRFENHTRIRRKGDLEALITMPVIERISSADAALIEVEDFTCNQLKIKLDGASKLRGRGNVITDLYLNCNGAAQIDLYDSSIKNARLDVNGAGYIQLKMDGGELTGSAAGAAKIVYTGTVSAENVRTAGVVSVRHRD